MGTEEQVKRQASITSLPELDILKEHRKSGLGDVISPDLVLLFDGQLVGDDRSLDFNEGSSSDDRWHGVHCELKLGAGDSSAESSRASTPCSNASNSTAVSEISRNLLEELNKADPVNKVYEAVCKVPWWERFYWNAKYLTQKNPILDLLDKVIDSTYLASSVISYMEACYEQNPEHIDVASHEFIQKEFTFALLLFVLINVFGIAASKIFGDREYFKYIREEAWPQFRNALSGLKNGRHAEVNAAFIVMHLAHVGGYAVANPLGIGIGVLTAIILFAYHRQCKLRRDERDKNLESIGLLNHINTFAADQNASFKDLKYIAQQVNQVEILSSTYDQCKGQFFAGTAGSIDGGYLFGCLMLLGLCGLSVITGGAPLIAAAVGFGVYTLISTICYVHEEKEQQREADAIKDELEIAKLKSKINVLMSLKEKDDGAYDKAQIDYKIDAVTEEINRIEKAIETLQAASQNKHKKDIEFLNEKKEKLTNELKQLNHKKSNTDNIGQLTQQLNQLKERFVKRYHAEPGQIKAAIKVRDLHSQFDRDIHRLEKNKDAQSGVKDQLRQYRITCDRLYAQSQAHFERFGESWLLASTYGQRLLNKDGSTAVDILADETEGGELKQNKASQYIMQYFKNQDLDQENTSREDEIQTRLNQIELLRAYLELKEKAKKSDVVIINQKHINIAEALLDLEPELEKAGIKSPKAVVYKERTLRREQNELNRELASIGKLKRLFKEYQVAITTLKKHSLQDSKVDQGITDNNNRYQYLLSRQQRYACKYKPQHQYFSSAAQAAFWVKRGIISNLKNAKAALSFVSLMISKWVLLPMLTLTVILVISVPYTLYGGLKAGIKAVGRYRDSRKRLGEATGTGYKVSTNSAGLFGAGQRVLQQSASNDDLIASSSANALSASS